MNNVPKKYNYNSGSKMIKLIHAQINTSFFCSV